MIYIEEARVIKLEKYMEFISNSVSLFRNIEIDKYTNGVKLNKDKDYFIGMKLSNDYFEVINQEEFDQYFIVCRWLKWSKQDGYTLRILKVNSSQQVDFSEEEQQLRCRINIVL